MDRQTSDAIRISRVLCIVFMSYVHLHFFKLEGAEFPLVETVLVDTLGRSSVPLLSAISGFLMVHFFGRRNYVAAAVHRARALVVPMIVWNSIAVALWGWSGPNDILALTSTSKLIYLAFLRDLFVMSLLTPLLLFLARKSSLLFLVGAFAFYIADTSTIVILRPQIAFFYCIGIWLSVRPLNMPSWWKPAAIGALVALCVLSALWPEAVNNSYGDNLVRRPVASLGFWAAALLLADRYQTISRLDVNAFPFFLAHGIMFHYVGAAYSRMEFLHFPAAYLAIWLVTPIVCFSVISLAWGKTGRLGRMVAA